MSADNHNPHGQPGAEELDGALRQAVEQVKADPVPADAQERALAKAGRIGAAAGRKPSPARRRLLVAASIAAVVLPPLLGWMITEPGPQVGGLRFGVQLAEGRKGDPLNGVGYPQQKSFGDGTSNSILLPGDEPSVRFPDGTAWRRGYEAMGARDSDELGFYPPTMALVVKGTSRIHTNIDRPITAPGDLREELNRLAGANRDKQTAQAWRDTHSIIRNYFSDDRGGQVTDVKSLQDGLKKLSPEQRMAVLDNFKEREATARELMRKQAESYEVARAATRQRELVENALKQLDSGEKPEATVNRLINMLTGIEKEQQRQGVLLEQVKKSLVNNIVKGLEEDRLTSTPDPNRAVSDADIDKLKKAAESWASLPEKDRSLALQDAIKALRPDQRKLIEDYLKKLAAGEK
ncbi:MAG TPA: hypothetical protein VFA26_17100, partial [Gemmataceae bacterium]|nr:hypothetical protein [Gemmataceae bacterium]